MTSDVRTTLSGQRPVARSVRAVRSSIRPHTLRGDAWAAYQRTQTSMAGPTSPMGGGETVGLMTMPTQAMGAVDTRPRWRPLSPWQAGHGNSTTFSSTSRRAFSTPWPATAAPLPNSLHPAGIHSTCTAHLRSRRAVVAPTLRCSTTPRFSSPTMGYVSTARKAARRCAVLLEGTWLSSLSSSTGVGSRRLGSRRCADAPLRPPACHCCRPGYYPLLRARSCSREPQLGQQTVAACFSSEGAATTSTAGICRRASLSTLPPFSLLAT